MKKTIIYTKFHFLLFLMATVLILVRHKNNFDHKGDKISQAWAKGKDSFEGENSYLFWTVLGERWI